MGSYDVIICPSKVVDIVEDEETGEMRGYDARACGASLHLEFKTTYCLTRDDLAHDQNITPEWAHAISWEITCENGHVLASDAQTTLRANDTAEPCYPGRVLQALGLDLAFQAL